MAPVGQFGQEAAVRFKQVPVTQRHSTPVQYTPNIQQDGARNDLFAYAQSFDDDGDGFFSAQNIADASGLDLSKLSAPEEIETLWDLDGDNRVDLKEMWTGLAHLDLADAYIDDDGTEKGGLDGQITERGREAVENNSWGGFIREHNNARTQDRLTQDPLSITDPDERQAALSAQFVLANSQPTDDFSQLTDIDELLRAVDDRLANGVSPSDTFGDSTALQAAIASGQVTGFSESFLDVLAQQPAPGTPAQAYSREEIQSGIANRVAFQQKRYRETLKDIYIAADVEGNHQRYLDLTA